MKRVGFIGMGALARKAMQILWSEADAIPEVVGILETAAGRTQAEAFLRGRIPVVGKCEELLGLGPELVVEAAGQGAVRQYGESILKAGRNLLVISIGSLADQNLFGALKAAAGASGTQLLLPSGALGGIDALAAARFGGLTTVHQRISKPPRAWKGTPAEGSVDLDDLVEAAVLFEGSAREAATQYPQNANVAAAVALAGVGFERSRVSLVADPALSGPHHSIEAEGTFGKFKIDLQGIALPDNPKSSTLAALSIARAIVNTSAAVVI